ncbi:TetR/AcrR family transcriptional regulator [Angustibacter aerolatus]|uniref:TetR family transcriptional regulator n=1 Tax=Angustibacter aerolatus TaxID=1162965 RepID=A0ABQ6JE39_9ACTN|nr:TetR/AcrR family transcriptional regulator [Angustibacter aerolatus]GMA86428.1 TetR family transcriptional regulator [Angustibacter aerolatus]
MQEQPSAERAPRRDARRNRERVVVAAVAALHRDGPGVPMATIAADAGVGVGTLYRHFPTRDDLLEELTHRSFRRLLDHLEEAVESGGTAVEVLGAFLTAVVRDRDDLVLRSTGGPASESDRTRAVQALLHDGIRALVARGRDDGTIRRDLDVPDVAWLGATLAQPGRGPGWDAVAARLLATYLAGLGVAG